MTKYDNLLCRKHILNQDIKREKRELHLQFIKDNQLMVRTLDILVVLMILMNFGATIMTNYMAVKKEPEVKIMEVNPLAAEIGNYEEHPAAQNYFSRMVAFKVLAWGLLVALYCFARRGIYNYFGFTWLLTIVVAYTLLFSQNFFNDFGFWLGKVVT